MGSDAARVTQDVVEIVYPFITASPTTITGAGISQDIIEVIVADAAASAAVSQGIVEVIVALPSTPAAYLTQDIVEAIYPRSDP